MGYLIVASVIFSAVFCHVVAEKRGLPALFWGIMGALFGPFAIPFVFLAKPKDDVN